MKVLIENVVFDLSNTEIWTQEISLTQENYEILHKAYNFYQDYCVKKILTYDGNEIKNRWREIRDYICEGDKYKSSICVYTDSDGTKTLK